MKPDSSGTGEQNSYRESSAKAAARLEWLVGFMVVRYSFVYRVLCMITRRPSQALPTMGVRIIANGNFELFYNPAFVNSQTDASLTYVLYHEMLHIVLHHCSSRRFDLHTLGNIAADYAVNELIPVASGTCEPPRNEDNLPIGCFVDDLKKEERFSEVKNSQTAEWYYDFLYRKIEWVRCTIEELAEWLKKNRLPQGFDSHDDWGENEIASERVRALIRGIGARGEWGDMSGAEQEIILAAQTRKVNWRNILRAFYGSLAWHVHESTRKRPNRRLGILQPGAKKVQVVHHLVAIDTSGSIDSGTLAQFLGVINQMADFVPIDLMQFDALCTEAPKPFDRRHTSFKFLGRGGTDFTPVLEIADKQRYATTVILTDGYAAAPEKPKTQVVWVMPEGCEPPVEWGRRIYL